MKQQENGRVNADAQSSRSMEQLIAENERLREEQRLLLQAMFPPEPEETIDLSDYAPVTVDQLLAAAHEPQDK